MWEYWKMIPKKGDMTILDRSYYLNLFNNTKINKSDLNTYNDIFESFEKQLIDDNMIIIKFFLHLNKKNHMEYNEHMDKILDNTNFDFAPWHVISAKDLKEAGKEVLGITKKIVREKIENLSLDTERVTETAPFLGKNIINNLDLSLKIDGDTYDSSLEKLQNRAAELTYKLYNKNIPTILVFEGMDAAGKGGAIKRLTRLMDAGFYDVAAISSPSETENQYHYLWRFYGEFPSRGKIKIFDRSWYGRVLVERIEGFASEVQWRRAYNEINLMEKGLYAEGALIIKFLIVIDKDEQLRRFEERKNDVNKVYKLTDEDWRNRDKWNLYVEAMDEMLEKTNKEYAPWVIVEGNDKKYARLKVLREFIKRAEEIISKH